MIREPTLEEIQYLVTLPFIETCAFTGESGWYRSIYNTLRNYPKPVYVACVSNDDEPFRSVYLYNEHIIVCDPFLLENDDSILRWLDNVAGT